MNPTTLADFRGDYKMSGTQRNYTDCPVCGSDGRNTYVDPETGAWFCFAGQHHAGGAVDVGLDDKSPGRDILDMLEPKAEVVTWEETELPPWEPLTPLAKRYLLRRGVTAEEIRANGIVEWSGQYRALFPYFRSGELIFWTSRRYSEAAGEGPKYLSQPGRKPLYEPVTIRSRHPGTLIIVEGVMDALAVARAGYRAVALGGKSLPGYQTKNLLTLAADCGILVILLDGDALSAAFDLSEILSNRTSATIKIVVIAGDPGSMGPEELERLLL